MRRTIAPTSGVSECHLPSTVTRSAEMLAGDVDEQRRQEFNAVLASSLPVFRRIAMRVLRNAADAEDAVQEAMLSAHRNIARFDGRSQMSTWITTIVINAARMQIRRRLRRPTESFDQTLEDGKWAADQWPVDPRPTPEETIRRHQLHTILTKLVDRLSPSQRVAVRMRQQDRSLKEIARELRIPVGTLKARLARARAELTQRFHNLTEVRKAQPARRMAPAKRVTHFSKYGTSRAERLLLMPPSILNSQAGLEQPLSA